MLDLIKEDVVISGIGGYFPKSSNIGELQEHLLNNEILTETRWREGERGVTNIIGKVPTEYFDHSYFGIHRQQCTFMDPMQRLILERTFEALIDAGVNPTEVKGRRVGVYMGSAIGENDNLFLESIVSGFGVTGHSRAMMPNRISYWLNLKGPSVAYDSNWIGGLEVLRLAFESIKSGQCESVIVGTANLALNSEFQWIYSDMGVLSPDGSTRSFDANAQGYARSDGIVVFYLQKASEAKRSYASILNVETMFNGNREGPLLDVDVPSMVSFMNEFYEKCPVKPEEVEFVEAYGSGLKKTDEKEIAALEQVYCKNRKDPLLIGSIKPNTGHSEASACLFSVAKVLVAMESETIPATLQYETPNPNCKALVDGRIEVVTKNKKWGAKYAAVNAIGIDSYYGHILLKSNPKKKIQHKDDKIPRLIIASTRTEEGIKSILETVRNKPYDPEYYQLLQDLFAKPILGHLYRGYTLAGIDEPKEEFDYHQGNKRQIWFVYSGMGSQWCGMISDLMKIPVCADAINRCHKVLEPKGVDLIGIISSMDKTTYDNILHSFVGIAAIQIALTDVLKAVGIVPDGIIGHSVGELGCAYADGCLTAEQMILSAYCRGRASLEATLIPGMMAAVGVGYQQIKNKIPPTIEVACHNGPDSATLSGPREDMEKFVKQLQDQGTFARLVNVANIAYHSRYIKPAAPLLLKYLKEVIPGPVKRSSKWVSTSNLEENWNTELAQHSSAEYHTNNLLSSVLFEEGLKHIPKDSILIEIAPHGLLQAILKRSLKSGCTNIALTQRGYKSGVEFLLSSLGKMYLAGMDLNISNIYPKIEYPVSRGTSCVADLSHWNHSESWRTGLEDKLHSLFGVRDIQVTLNSEEFRECIGHQVDDKVILPTSYYLNIVYQIISSISTGHKEIVFENLYFRKHLTIPKIGSVPLHAMVQKGSGEFEIVSGKDIIMTGKMTFPPANEKFMSEPDVINPGEDSVQLTGSDVYSELQHRGYKYSGQFKAIKSLTLCEEGSVSVAQWNNKWPLFLEAIIQQHLLTAGEKHQDIQVPKTIQKITINQNLFPTEKSDLRVDYCYATSLLCAEGMQVTGMKTVPLETDSKSVYFDTVESVPLSNATHPKIETTLSAALQLCLNNFPDQYITNVMINEIETEEPLLDSIKNVLSQYPKLNPNLLSVKDAKQIAVHQSYPLLVLYNDTIKPDIAKFVAASHAFLLVKTDKNILSYPDIITVAEFTVNGTCYSVVRKANTSEVIIVNVKGDTLSIKDLKRSSVSWVNELYAAAESAKAKHKRVYLVSSIIPVEGFVNFVEELRALPNMETLRVLFNLDKKPIDPKSPTTQTIFKQDLVLLVLKDGVYSSYLSIPVSFKENTEMNTATNNILKNKTVEYIGVNLRDETLNPAVEKKQELGSLDYSGVTNSGQRIMGLARVDKDSCRIIPDPILSWEVPKDWSLEDGATVPYAYTSAYYALLVKAELKPGETVLIHAGCSAIGLAAISVAYVQRCTIYTTVSTDWQRAYLKKQFAFLKDHHILNSDNTSFEPFLMMSTGGKGAEVILNCLSGSLLEASLACIADYGRFIHIGKYDLEENSSIGMYCFLRNTSFYAVNLEDVFEQSNDVKEELKKMVVEGLDKFCVRPLVRKVVTEPDVEPILKSLKKSSNVGKILIKVNNTLPLNRLNTSKPNQFLCDSKSSYLIYGGSAEQWTDVTEWLVLRGARKIIVSSDAKPQQNSINRRLSLLQTYFGVDIILAPNKAHTREGAAELLSEVYFLGPIHAVFLLPNNNKNARASDIKPVQYIDNALRTTAPKALLVNFINTAAGICQVRADAGFSAYNVQWLKTLDFTDALNALDAVLRHKVRDVLVKIDKDSDTKEESSQGLFKKLTQMIPASLEIITEQMKSAPEEPEMVQLVTEGPRQIRELAPLFIVPGITGQEELEEMAMSLLYPTFCAVYPAKDMSLKDLAEAYAQQIKKIWPEGPYNIVGVSWGGVLTIEIAKLLGKENVSLHLYFVDGAPNILQSALKHLGKDKNEIEVNLLSRILNINDTQLVKKLNAAPDWTSRVKTVLDNYDRTIPDREELEKGLMILKNRLEAVSNYQPSGDLVSGSTHLIRPSDASKYDNCGLTTYCKQTPEVVLINGDHITIIKSRDTAEYINETFQLI